MGGGGAAPAVCSSRSRVKAITAIIAIIVVNVVAVLLARARPPSCSSLTPPHILTPPHALALHPPIPSLLTPMLTHPTPSSTRRYVGTNEDIGWSSINTVVLALALLTLDAVGWGKGLGPCLGQHGVRGRRPCLGRHGARGGGSCLGSTRGEGGAGLCLGEGGYQRVGV